MIRGHHAVVLVLLLACVAFRPAHGSAPDSCDSAGFKVQVLGSGGPDLANGRAGSGYVVWIGGKARALVDAGPGAAARFTSTGGRASDLALALFTQLYADHTLDLPAFVSLALQEGRTQPLPLYGPTGSRLAPSTVTFVRTLLDSTRGAYRHLGDVLSPLVKEGFKLEAREVGTRASAVGVRREDNGGIIDMRSDHFQIAATYVNQGLLPMLAWRLRVGDRSVVFTGDANGEAANLERLARNADLLIAHHAVIDNSAGAERSAQLTPSAIGRLAAQAGVKRLVLSHRTRDTLGSEETTLGVIRARYAGPVVFADDLNCFTVP